MKVLTREQYAEAIDAYHERRKARLLFRFDVGHRQYGRLDLDGGRDWAKERQAELDDATAYEIFEIERMKRIKP